MPLIGAHSNRISLQGEECHLMPSQICGYPDKFEIATTFLLYMRHVRERERERDREHLGTRWHQDGDNQSGTLSLQSVGTSQRCEALNTATFFLLSLAISSLNLPKKGDLEKQVFQMIPEAFFGSFDTEVVF